MLSIALRELSTTPSGEMKTSRWIAQLDRLGSIRSRRSTTLTKSPGIAKMVSAFVGGELDRNGLREVLHTLVFDSKHVTDELVEERFCILQTQPKDVLSRMIIPSMGEQLGDLKCPVYGFWGEQDEMTPVSGASRFTQQCEQAQFITLAHCGHWVMVEHAQLFNAYLSGILLNKFSLKG